MQHAGVPAEEATFRANAGYDLVLLDRLDPVTRDRLAGEDDPGDLYGALVPRPGSGLEVRAVSPDTALLVLTLGSPGLLPRYVIERLGPAIRDTVERLVLDGILEIRHDGAFVSGAAAAPAFVPACA